MSYKYFGLREDAFGIIPDVRFVYLDTARANITTHLTSGIHQGNGLMVLSADRGMGKTMMLRHLAATLQADGEIDLLARNGVLCCDSGPSFNDIVITCGDRLGVFNEDVGLDDDISDVAEILKRQRTGNAPSALLLDGAEHLSEQSIESIVALAALPAEERGCLSIVLAACPDSPARPIDSTLAILQRMPDVSVRLERLPDDDVESYILHRLQTAGHDGSALFAPDAIGRIIQYSEGNPLEINRICRSAMVIASHQTSETVSAPMVESALMVEEVGNGRRERASGDRSTSKTAHPVGPLDMEHLPGAPTESIEIPERPPGPAGHVSGAATARTEGPEGNFHFADERDSGVGNNFDIEDLASFPNRLPEDDFLEDKYFLKRSLQRIQFLLNFVRAFTHKSMRGVTQFMVSNKPRLKVAWQFLEKSTHNVVQFAISNKPRVKSVWQILKRWGRGAGEFMLANKPRMFAVSVVFGVPLFFLVATASYFDFAPTDGSPEFKQATHEPLEKAGLGNPQSYYQLGRSFEEGRGVPRDLAMAYAWYDLAAARGIPEAERARDTLAGEMTQEELAEAHRLAVKWAPVGEMEREVASAALNSLPSNTKEGADAAVGETSPNRAMEIGDTAVIEAVPDAGVQVDAPGNEERKPLNTAAAGREDGVAPPMERDADPALGETDGTAAASREDVVKLLEHEVTLPLKRKADPAHGGANGTAAADQKYVVTLQFERNGGPALGEADGTVVSDPVPDEGDPVSPVSSGTENGTSPSQPDLDAFETAAGHEDTAGGNEFDTVSREEISQDLLGATVDDGSAVAVTTPEEAARPEEAAQPEETSQQASRQPAASPRDTPAERTDDRAAAVAASRKIQQAKIKPDNEATARAPSPEPSRTAAKSVKTPPVQETQMQIKTAQYLLSRLGYDPGPADGLAGRNTRAAVSAYQTDKGETADGKITEALVNRLEAEVVADEAQRLAKIEARREQEARLEKEAELNRQRESKDVWSNLLGGLQKVVGYEFNSTEDPDKMNAYCRKNDENWIYDFGTERFVLCRDFLHRQPTASR